MADVVHPGEPSKAELVAAIGPATRVPELRKRFGLSDHRVRRLMDLYGIPPFPVGFNHNTPSDTAPDPTRPVGVPLPRDRTELDDLCDREAANHQRRSQRRVRFVLRAIEGPAPEPVGAALGDRWRTRALCRGLDPALFIRESRANTAEANLAKRVCAACPVRDVCPFSETERSAKERRSARSRAA